MDNESAAVVVYRKGERWAADVPLARQDHVFDHIRFVRRVLGEGVARLAGPVCGLDECPSDDTIGLVVFNLPAEDVARLIGEDPAVKAGLLTASVHPFYPL
jgi:hypothetical protein